MPDWRVETEYEKETGRWIAEVLDVPGALAYGATEDEARAKAIGIADATPIETLTETERLHGALARLYAEKGFHELAAHHLALAKPSRTAADEDGPRRTFRGAEAVSGAPRLDRPGRLYRQRRAVH
jgi:predicted RNase H-like HicB family nuclease